MMTTTTAVRTLPAAVFDALERSVTKHGTRADMSFHRGGTPGCIFGHALDIDRAENGPVAQALTAVGVDADMIDDRIHATGKHNLTWAEFCSLFGIVRGAA